MKCARSIGSIGHLALAWMAVTLLATPSRGADVYLVAKEFTKTMPDGVPVTMWGFAAASPGFTTVQAPTVPGPRLTVPPGDTTLNVHLRNDLPSDGVSIVIPGQMAILNPVRTPPDAQGRTRVTSFNAETAPGGGQRVYNFTNLKRGSYAYHSGTHPAKQVQMGLYGPVTVEAGVREAYPGVTYDNEVILFHSEIDPALHEAVATGTYGTAAYPSTINYVPKYFLINGAPHPNAAPVVDHPILLGERVLVRFFNQGLRSHVPTLDGAYMSVIAEDGNRYPFPKEQYSVLLPAGKTVDALLTASRPGSLPLYDRALGLTNAGAPAGGMLAFLGVQPVISERRVAAKSDDAEERPSGSVNLTSSKLELVRDADNQTVGIRFTGLNIPPGAQISRAYVEFTVASTTSEPTSLLIEGQASGNAPTFTSTSGNISTRPRTTAQVPWSPPAWGGGKQQTVDIRSIIQEIVNQGDWASGNALAIIITGTGKRVARSYDGDKGKAPLLHVEHGVAAAAAAPPPTTTTTTTLAAGSTTTTTAAAASTTTTTQPPTSQTLCRAVQAGADDAEQSSSGSVDLGSSDLELVNDGNNQTVGMRFTGMTVPAGATIDRAYVQFQVDEATTGATSLTVTGQDVGNAPAFSTSSGNVSTRARTVAVGWPNVPGWPTVGARGADQQTPDLKAIVQQIVDRGDWASGNAMVIIVEGTGKRTAESRDGSTPGAPTLCVEYHTGGGGPTTTTTTTTLAAASTTTTTLAAASTTTTTQPPTLQTLCRAVQAGADDAEQSSSGSVDLGSSDLELVQESTTQTVGMRFTGMTIPAGATIDRAYVQFQVDEATTGATSLTVTGQDVGNAPAFSTSSGNVSTRARTVAVGWPNVPGWPTVGARGADQQTPDLKAIVQQIVNRGDWASGNAMVIIVEGTGKRTAESRDGSTPGAPTLCVDYYGGGG